MHNHRHDNKGRQVGDLDWRGEQDDRSKVERRYKLLCRTIKKTYVNSIVRWRNPNRPEAPAGPGRSANPSEPDRSLWVGPAAMTWLLGEPQRCIQPFAGAVQGTISIP
jgi:hypothetical protein